MSEDVFRWSWIWLLFVGCGSSQEPKQSPHLTLFAGAASQPATEEVIAAFEAETGIEVDANFGGSGYVLSQMKLSQQGDLYFPGSSDYMDIAKADNVVRPETERIIAYLVPAINVQAGNPKGIRSLMDLTEPGLRLAIANPENVCLGTYAVEIMETHLSEEEQAAFARNLVTYTESCAKTATVISLKAVDAVIGWRVFEYWDSTRIETIPLAAAQIQRIGYMPIAISKYCQQPELAQRFIDFLISKKGQRVFERYHYFSSEEAAWKWIESSDQGSLPAASSLMTDP